MHEWGSYHNRSRKVKTLSTQQGTHCTGKTGKMTKTFPVRENTGNFEFWGKYKEFGLLKFANSLIIKVKDILIFATKISKLF